MDSISALLGEMHAQALAMNAEVKGRADQLDNLVDTSLRQNTNLKGAVKQTANVGGRSAKAAMREGIGASDRQQTLGPSTPHCAKSRLLVCLISTRPRHLRLRDRARAAQQGVDRQVRTACGRAIDASLLTSHAHIDMPTVWRLSYLWLQRSSDSTKWYLVARSRSRAQWVEASNKSYERSLPPRTHRHARGWSSLVEMGNAVCLHSCQLVSGGASR